MDDEPLPLLAFKKKIQTLETIHHWNSLLFSWGFGVGAAKGQPLPQIFEAKEEYGTVYASGYHIALFLLYLKEE